MYTIAMLLPDRFFAGGAFGTLDILHIANRLAAHSGEALFQWHLLSENGKMATAATGITLSVDGAYEAADTADAIILPGIGYDDTERFEQRLQQEQQLTHRLRQWHEDNKLIAANCTSVALLAESGILNGRTATTSWWLGAWFRRRYPTVTLHPHAILCESPGLLCSGATTSYFNLALRLVEKVGGADLAMNCARMMLIDSHRASQAPYATLQQYQGHNDPLITRCQAWLQENLAQAFRLDLLARDIGTSERTLNRRFRQVLGDTPLRYLQQMRLMTARRLLESTSLGVEQIVSRVGYADVSTFRRLFKRELQCSPGEYRRRFSETAH